MNDTVPETPGPTTEPAAPEQATGTVSPPLDGARLFHAAMAGSELLIAAVMLYLAYGHVRELLP